MQGCDKCWLRVKTVLRSNQQFYQRDVLFLEERSVAIYFCSKPLRDWIMLKLWDFISRTTVDSIKTGEGRGGHNRHVKSGGWCLERERRVDQLAHNHLDRTLRRN